MNHYNRSCPSVVELHRSGFIFGGERQLAATGLTARPAILIGVAEIEKSPRPRKRQKWQNPLW